jgi:hypothetical protein
LSGIDLSLASYVQNVSSGTFVLSSDTKFPTFKHTGRL